MTETTAATISAKRAAPGLRTISGATTAGMTQTAADDVLPRVAEGLEPNHTKAFQNQKTTRRRLDGRHDEDVEVRQRSTRLTRRGVTGNSGGCSYSISVRVARFP